MTINRHLKEPLSVKNPALAKEWDYKKNAPLTPDDVSAGTHKKAWWVCSLCGFSWCSEVKSRNAGAGCPKCGIAIQVARNQANSISKHGSLATNNPDLSKEWNYTKNGDLKPDDVMAGSGKKVWWKCEKGHEWQAVIVSRSRGNGCPICAKTCRTNNLINNKLLKQGSLAQNNPELAKEWHPSKNGQLSPNEVMTGSKDKVWWQCKNGHEWQATVYSRNAGNGCPFCANRTVLVGFNDIATTNPQLVKEWNFDRNSNLTPKDVTVGSSRKIWWKCSKGHEWEASIINRSKGNGCPYCTNKKILVGYNDLLTLMPEVASEWNYDKNGDLKPEEVSTFSHKKVWWICKEGHEWEATISHRTSGTTCPYCSGRIVIEGKNDLATTNPKLSKEWNYSRNGDLTPYNTSAGSDKKVWWICDKGHEWKAVISSRSHGSGCPVCSNQSVLVGYNDLATTNPELVKEWNYERNNGLLPSEVIAGSGKKVWWKCERGHEWAAVIWNRANGGGCPRCARNGSSLPEQGVAYYLESVCKIEQRIKINGDEIDVYLPDYKIGIEYDGQYFHDQKSHKDSQKDLRIEQNGIYLIRLKESNVNEVLNDRIIRYVADDLGPNYKWLIKQLCIILTKLTGNEAFDSIIATPESDRLKIRERFDLYKKENSLAVKKPELVNEWNFERNGILIPEMFSFSSKEKVWWKCSKGHEWQAVISSRYQGVGCPYCSNKKVLVGFNDLVTTNPKLIKEWNYAKNTNLSPNEVTICSGRKVWWKCSQGHEWEASIANRSKGRRCPYCVGKKVVVGSTDIATTNPELLMEWDYSKNTELLPEEVSSGSEKSVWWLCDQGHSWTARIIDRVKGYGCPFCSGRRVLAGYNDLLTSNPELAKEWNYEKNGSVTPDSVTAWSNKDVWWKCSNGHEWCARIGSRSAGNGCPYCSNNKVLAGFNDLATTMPKLIEEWDFEKNQEITPDSVTKASNKTVWWKCSKGHEWKAVISSRSAGHGCPVCSRRGNPVICIETGKVYENCSEAFRDTGVYNINRCCRKLQETAGGYHWKFVNEVNE